MKRTIRFALALLAIGMICGCGGEDKKNTDDTSKADGVAAVPQEVASFKSSTPAEAVTEFLNALRAGDRETTEALLTTRAREETAAHDLVVDPPGAATATFSIGRIQEGNEGSAYVNSVWTEDEDDSEFEVVWILRQETAGWRIAGMATELPDSEEPIILNFEDLSELEKTVQEAEVAERQPATRTQNPGTTMQR